MKVLATAMHLHDQQAELLCSVRHSLQLPQLLTKFPLMIVKFNITQAQMQDVW